MIETTKQGVLQVWKFPVKIEDEIEIEMPRHARIIAFQAQRDEPCLWVLVDPTEEREKRQFRLVGTGHPISGRRPLIHVGTCQMLGGSLVWHLFEYGTITK